MRFYIFRAIGFSDSTSSINFNISRLSACPWSRVLLGDSSYRCESLLVHKFSECSFLIPDKTKSTLSSKVKQSYKGGTVLSPQKGFYDSFILLLDFNSLYPSVIREYNICFTTIDPSHPNVTKPQSGILPNIMESLLKQRQTIKKNLMEAKGELERIQLDIQQKAVKLLANSMYGYLGFAHSRFKAKHLAEMITQKEREALETAVERVQSFGKVIIYGDTDSVMVNSGSTNIDDVFVLAKQLQEAIKKGLHFLEMGLDGIFRKMLLVSKKKYAALVYDPKSKTVKLEKKGLDMVRRDWCDLTKCISEFILNQFMSDIDKEIAISRILKELENVRDMLSNNGNPKEDAHPEFESSILSITKEMLIIRKALTKPLESYSNQNEHAHVAVAKWMKENGHSVLLNSTIPYIVSSSNGKTLAVKVRHPDLI